MTKIPQLHFNSKKNDLTVCCLHSLYSNTSMRSLYTIEQKIILGFCLFSCARPACPGKSDNSFFYEICCFLKRDSRVYFQPGGINQFFG